MTTDRYKKYRRRHWISIYKIKKGCSVCGYNEDPVAMHFDHKDPKTKKKSIAHMLEYAIKTLIEEIRKCDVLCANCHCIKTHRERVLDGSRHEQPPKRRDT